jgi:hypothetical protein
MSEESKSYKEVKKMARRMYWKPVLTSVRAWVTIAVLTPFFALLIGFISKACYYAFMFAFNLF